MLSFFNCCSRLPFSSQTVKHVSSLILVPSDETHMNDGYAISIFKIGLGKSILPNENSREMAQFVLEAKEVVKQANFVF
jgi:hypothetical protein